MPAKSGDHGEKNFYGRVVQMPQTRRMWVVGGIKEGGKVVRGKIKPEGGVIGHGVEFAREIKNGW